MPTQSSVESAINFVYNILLKTAENVGMSVKVGAIPKGSVPRRSAMAHSGSCKRQIYPKWHDLECQTLLSNLNRISKLLYADPRNP